ncbi:MAG: sigma-70 family RNA polymerase sigma factor [Brevinematia bacterium]
MLFANFKDKRGIEFMEIRNLLLWYLSRDISKVRVIESDIGLVLRAKQGDKDAIKKLIDNNIKLVIKFVSRFRVCEDVFMDLINEGCLGILKAIKAFDPSKNIKFSSYASIWIKHSVLTYLYSNSFIKIPFRKRKIFRDIKGKINNSGGRLLDDELVNYGGISPNEYRAIDMLSSVVYFSDLNEFYLSSIFSSGNDLEYELDLNYIFEVIRNKLSKLSPKEQFILEHRYGLNGKEVKKLNSIAKIFGSTPEGVRYTEKKALAKLKRMLEKEGII